MGILDDIRNENKQKEHEEKMKRLSQNHDKEDFIINKILDELERCVRCGQYRGRDGYDSYSIEAHLGQVTLKTGDKEYRLIHDIEHYNWQEGCVGKIKDTNIIKIDHHPFEKIDEIYLQENLPPKVIEAFGEGVFRIKVNLLELYHVEKQFFSRFNKIVHMGKYTLMITFTFRL